MGRDALAQVRARAHRTFRDATLRTFPDRFELVTRGGFDDMVFVPLTWSRIIVHGAHDPIVVQGGDGDGDLDARLCWFARKDIAGLHAKVEGEARHGEYSADALLEIYRADLADAAAQGDADAEDAARAALDALADADLSSETAAFEALRACDPAIELPESCHRIFHPRVVWAHEAAKAMLRRRHEALWRAFLHTPTAALCACVERTRQTLLAIAEQEQCES